MRGFFRCDRRVTTQKHETQFRTAPVVRLDSPTRAVHAAPARKNTGAFSRKLRIFIEMPPVFRSNFPISSTDKLETKATTERTSHEIPYRSENTEIDAQPFGKEDK